MKRKTENKIINSVFTGNLSNSKDLWKGGKKIDYVLITVN